MLSGCWVIARKLIPKNNTRVSFKREARNCQVFLGNC